MKKATSLAALALAMVTTFSWAGSPADPAQVIVSIPVYKIVKITHGVCLVDKAGSQQQFSFCKLNGVIVGMMTKGKFGNQLIDYSTTQAAGSCQVTRQWKRQLIGYSVTYRYHDQLRRKFLPYDPADKAITRVRTDLEM